jgi:PBP1b-binding outer membrane lipoprotein LpoB
MFKFVAVSALALFLAGCSSNNEEDPVVETVPESGCSETGGVPQDTGEGSPCDDLTEVPVVE